MNGQCFCGAVRYRVEPPLRFIAHDHCSICRRIAGAAFVTWTGVPAAQFHLLQGEDSLTRFQATPEAERQFCSRCGSHLFFRSARWPGEVHVTVATLTDPLPSPPRAHVFYSDHVDWLALEDGLPRFGGATGTEPLDSEGPTAG